MTSQQQSELPPEPFPTMGRGMFNGALREPAAMIAFYGAFAAVGVVFFMAIKKGIDSGAEGALLAGIVMLVAFCGVGLVGVAIGIRRLQWKREYQRLTGRSPFA